jgi:hypothetical protein
MPQNTNLNVSPYFDDFSEFKNYQKVLFKPGTSIQARELTTLQTILQNQIEKFGKNLFKEGSMVIPGNIAYDSEYTCIKIDDTHLGLPVSLYIQNLVGTIVQGEKSGVKAKVENFITSEDSDLNINTLYIKYQSSGTDSVTSTFLDGENLITLQDISYLNSSIRNGSTFATTLISDSTAIGSAAKIGEGVYFIRGFFVTVPSQTVILDQYDNSPSYRVGLLIDEEIAVASPQYSDLYDNAQGFSNYAAPGADRLKITATLIAKPLNDFNDENFVELLRVENGILQKFVNSTNYNLIRDELARRTYDESGNYYITPFKVTPKECLNDRIGNNGIYYKGQVTSNGNVSSNDLFCLSISPGKAYVRGYEVETINNVIVDLEKPRSTDSDENKSIPFNLGKQIIVNNISGLVPVGFGTTSYIKLFDGRTGTAGISSGSQIGIARVYDLKAKNVSYANSTTQYELSLYDVQTYASLTLNATITQSVPAFIKGKSSDASGYLVQNVSGSNTLTLYQVSGTFIPSEQIEINGVDNSRTIISLRDYDLTDVHQFVGNNVSFTADPILSSIINIAPPGTGFSISANSGGISTITTSNQNFYIGIKTGDIISYTKPGETLVTYNKVSSVSSTAKSISISRTPSVPQVCIGDLPSVALSNVTDVRKTTLEVLNTGNVSLYSKLNKSNIANINLQNSNISIRRTSTITITNGGCDISTLFTDSNLNFAPFSEEDYILTFNNGIVETLSNQKVDTINKVLRNISINGTATFTYTLNKVNVKTKKKILNRCSSITIVNSSSTGSGIGSTTLNDGLTYSSVYGTRVQDKHISLNVPDVTDVLAIIESSSTSDPILPSVQLINLSSNILNAVQGELIVGQNSDAVAALVSSSGTNQIYFVYLNENTFRVNEDVVFQESNIKATVSLYAPGDKNILLNYIFDDGQRSEYLDYSRIIRKQGVSEPTKKIKIIYNNYTINPSDTGDFVAATSYEKSQYDKYVPFVNGIISSDIIDCRPRVATYSNSQFSPFEFNSRSFSSTTNSSIDVFAKNKNINLSYDYYLPRIDRLFLDKDGSFIINKGVPSLTPKIPNSLESSLEIGTIYIPAYLFDVSSAKINLVQHKRYRMQDISSLDQRISNVEYYTSLSLLESDTQNLKIKDTTTQLDKFKCGFFVDNFKSYNGGDISNINYRCSVDTIKGELKPQPYSTSVDLLLGSESIVGIRTTSNPNVDLRFVTDLGSNDIKKVGDVVCLNYSDVVFVQNRFATRTENVNPFNTVNWIGAISLSPSSDTWVETRNSQRTVDVEGSYQSSIQSLGIDTNTGLSPIDWGAWETTWTGTSTTQNNPFFTSQTGSNVVGETGFVNTGGRRGGWPFLEQSRDIEFQDSFINFSDQTSVTTRNEARQGIQFNVAQRFDTVNLGDRVVSTDIITYMRSRNIEIVAKRLKPNTLFYGFFDNINVSNYIIPKLIEVSVQSGTFVLGETVIGNLGSKSIVFRLATQNHKYGPYNSPTEIYTQNPYDNTSIIPSQYSSSTTLLNVDTASLELQSNSQFYGCISVGMSLIGQTSGAIAKISNVRLITDSNGTFIGSLFIPDPVVPSTPRFSTGTKTFVLTTSETNSNVSGFTQSSAEVNFSSTGTLNTVESETLRIRNAEISREIRTDNRTTSETDTRIVANTTFSNRVVTQTRWVDPLAQSFEVTDPNGVYITKCDIYFRTKSTANLPVTLQVRTMATGLPTQVILPFAEVVLDPDKVNISDDASVPTTFTFPSPVYLESGKAYAVVLMSSSDEYNVWISRMTETDISTISKPESERIIVSQQPLLGSLFKSQNGATWDPSQLEDLKMIVYRAEFTSRSGIVRFYNPTLNVGNNQIVSLRPNPIQMYSKSSLVGLGTSIGSSNLSNLTKGVQIFQNGNPNFSSRLLSVVGGIATGTSGTLTITNAGTGFTNTSKTYYNVSTYSITGFGQGATVNLTVSNGVAVAATVSVGGTGYSVGESLGIVTAQTDNLGKNTIITIPNSVGIITSINGLLVDNIQGKINNSDSTKFIGYVGSSGTTIITNASVTYLVDIKDGLQFKVTHNNHGMYSAQNIVNLSGIESDVPPSFLSSSYNSSTTADLPLTTSVGIFTSFENISVGLANTGYVLIKNEVLGYTGVNTSLNTLTGIKRGSNPGAYDANELVTKYELNGISLRRINRSNSISGLYDINLDDYSLGLNVSGDTGTDRTTGNSNNYPELFWKESKSAGTYQASSPVVSSLTGPKATQNILYNILRPNVQTLLPQTTSVSAKVRTFSGTSVDGSESSFVDQGYQEVSLNSDNIFSTPRLIASEINERSYLSNYPGNKSFTMEMALTTGDTKVSPMIDLDRVNIITVMTRLNSPIGNYATDYRVNSLTEDPNAAIYISKVINLKQSADSLKVIFDAYRDSTNDIRVFYRLLRTDVSNNNQTFDPFPGYSNLDDSGNVINPAENNGLSDKFVLPSTNLNEIGSYEFTANNLPLFNGFQIKIIMSGTNQSVYPRISSLRAIATKS